MTRGTQPKSPHDAIIGGMETLLAVLLGLNLVVLTALVVLVRGQQRRTAAAESAIGLLEPYRPLPEELEAAFTTGKRRVITIEILNPLELAATKSRFGGVAAAVAPGALRRLVYEQTVREMRVQMAEEGVVAEVGLHVAR